MHYIDSHTAGEPTRVIIDGGPALGSGTINERLARLRTNHDDFRQTVINEPRGSDALVGALLCEPDDPSCEAGVIFFNNAGYLGMCGHGAIGVAVTLGYLDRIGLGKFRLQTPVGVIEVDRRTEHQIAIENVRSYRYKKAVVVDVDGHGPIEGDIAWGGNWFFLCKEIGIEIAQTNIRKLTDLAGLVRRSLRAQDITGEGGQEIDHIEFFGPAENANAHSRNFVYCPGGAYDRSPCGTGTSAKVACLATEGVLSPGEEWVQESVIGSVFQVSYQRCETDGVIPTVVGEAYICGKGELIQQDGDLFRNGIPSEACV
ncbi:proline racemase family protein [Thalassoroseus pseudoceratinae]|uniref:proline racemase family protein n=1 Tax=Thalassoroseus pseudoceratinae TaxID=2713176 RepID=UPI00142344C0|nr:proline racemase family protein [Thalassoroseus pseudoceratinae]